MNKNWFLRQSKPAVLTLFVAADPFHCPKNRCGHRRLVNVFSIIEKLNLIASKRESTEPPGKKKFQASACRQLPSPKLNDKSQWTSNVKMSDYSCGTIKLKNDPNGRI